jgi:hypothetical protein
MKETKTIWVPCADQLVQFLASKPEDRPIYTTIISPDYDMTTEGWVKVGSAEVTYAWETGNEVYGAALSAVDMKLQEMEKDYFNKRSALREFRSTLLCLEAPEPEFTAPDSAEPF